MCVCVCVCVYVCVNFNIFVLLLQMQVSTEALLLPSTSYPLSSSNNSSSSNISNSSFNSSSNSSSSSSSRGNTLIPWLDNPYRLLTFPEAAASNSSSSFNSNCNSSNSNSNCSSNSNSNSSCSSDSRSNSSSSSSNITTAPPLAPPLVGVPPMEANTSTHPPLPLLPLLQLLLLLLWQLPPCTPPRWFDRGRASVLRVSKNLEGVLKGAFTGGCTSTAAPQLHLQQASPGMALRMGASIFSTPRLQQQFPLCGSNSTGRLPAWGGERATLFCEQQQGNYMGCLQAQCRRRLRIGSCDYLERCLHMCVYAQRNSVKHNAAVKTRETSNLPGGKRGGCRYNTLLSVCWVLPWGFVFSQICATKEFS